VDVTVMPEGRKVWERLGALARQYAALADGAPMRGDMSVQDATNARGTAKLLEEAAYLIRQGQCG
jgi:hypothetical protein